MTTTHTTSPTSTCCDTQLYIIPKSEGKSYLVCFKCGQPCSVARENQWETVIDIPSDPHQASSITSRRKSPPPKENEEAWIHELCQLENFMGGISPDNAIEFIQKLLVDHDKALDEMIERMIQVAQTDEYERGLRRAQEVLRGGK